MTTVTLTSFEQRHSKAILIAADAGQWLRPDRLIAGRRAVGIPSQTKRGLYHWTDGHTCTCYDFRRRQLACKHCIAYRLDAIARPHQPQPASDTVDGLAQMLDQRLAAERFRLDRILGKRPPLYATDQRGMANRYDEIFGRFDDDESSYGVIPAAQIVRED
jgi:hypothetical protein